jgi:hypothetical protein
MNALPIQFDESTWTGSDVRFYGFSDFEGCF